MADPCRRLPPGQVDHFSMPPLETVPPLLGEGDRGLVLAIHSQLVEGGAIDSDDIGFQSVGDLAEVLDEANTWAQDERDFHPEFHSAEVEQLLQEQEGSGGVGWQNPLVEELDSAGVGEYTVGWTAQAPKEALGRMDDPTYGGDVSGVSSPGRSEGRLTVHLPDGTMRHGDAL